MRGSSRYGQAAALLFLLLVAGATGCGTATSTGSHASGLGSATAATRQAMNRHTRVYMNAISACQIAVGLAILDIRKGKTTDLQLADETTHSRDVCDGVRSRLATLDTDHFDDQAATGFYAVDRSKSGLNAVLAYLDTPQPTKIIEARNKLRDGDQSAAQAIAAINRRRRAYGLPSFNP